MMVKSQKIINGKKYYYFGTMSRRNAIVFIRQTRDYDELNGHKRLLRMFKRINSFRKGEYDVFMTNYL